MSKLVTKCLGCGQGVLREYEQASPTHWEAKKGCPEIHEEGSQHWLVCPDCGASNFMSDDFPARPGEVLSVVRDAKR
jgi:hypothetical protein